MRPGRAPGHLARGAGGRARAALAVAVVVGLACGGAVEVPEPEAPVIQIEMLVASERATDAGFAPNQLTTDARKVPAGVGSRLWLGVRAPSAGASFVLTRSAEHVWTVHGAWAGPPPELPFPDGIVLREPADRLVVLAAPEAIRWLEGVERIDCSGVEAPPRGQDATDTCGFLQGLYGLAPSRRVPPEAMRTTPPRPRRPGAKGVIVDWRAAHVVLPDGTGLGAARRRHERAGAVAVDIDLT